MSTPLPKRDVRTINPEASAPAQPSYAKPPPLVNPGVLFKKEQHGALEKITLLKSEDGVALKQPHYKGGTDAYPIVAPCTWSLYKLNIVLGQDDVLPKGVITISLDSGKSEVVEVADDIAGPGLFSSADGKAFGTGLGLMKPGTKMTVNTTQDIGGLVVELWVKGQL